MAVKINIDELERRVRRILDRGAPCTHEFALEEYTAGITKRVRCDSCRMDMDLETYNRRLPDMRRREEQYNDALDALDDLIEEVKLLRQSVACGAGI